MVVRRSNFSSNDKSGLQLAASQRDHVRLAMAKRRVFSRLYHIAVRSGSLRLQS